MQRPVSLAHMQAWRISGNCTVIGDLRDQRAICIDPGGDIEQIMKLLSEHRLCLTQILITHGARPTIYPT